MANRFNKYKFLDELKEYLTDEFGCPHCAAENGEEYVEPTDEQIEDYVISYIGDQTIYYYNCWLICLEFQPNDFMIPYTGNKAKDINELAFYLLLDFVMQDIRTFTIEKAKTLN